jgi:RND family efflux transporter MFP subunit
MTNDQNNNPEENKTNGNTLKPNTARAIKILAVVVIAVVIIAVAYGIVKRLIIAKFVSQQMGAFKPPAVDIRTPEIKNVPLFYEFTGTAEPVEEVTVRARVTGYLERVAFEEGSYVKKGQLLFEIEDEAYIAAHDRAQASLASAKAELQRAQADLERVKRAVQTNAVSQQQLTRTKAEYDQARAAVDSAKARLDDAELNLSYTKITSPINGRIGKTMVDIGNLVGHGTPTPLASIVALEPVYVSFYISENFFRNGLDIDSVKKSRGLKFLVSLTEQGGFDFEGKIDYIDNVVDKATGTIMLRGTLPNKAHKIIPGMYTRVKLPIGTRNNAMLVPEESLQSDISGKYLLTVDDQNIVHRHHVKTGRLIDGMRVVIQGIEKNQRFVYEGIQYAQPGMKVEVNGQKNNKNKNYENANSDTSSYTGKEKNNTEKKGNDN